MILVIFIGGYLIFGGQLRFG